MRRVVILGHSGFIGSALAARLGAKRPDVELMGRSFPEFDLTRPSDADALRPLLDGETAVVLCSAVKRQDGDTQENYLKNVEMAVQLCRALGSRPLGRLLFMSSAAVYGEDVHNTRISEVTSVDPRSYYGMAKYAAERLFQKTFQARGGRGLVVLRPPTVYGPGEIGAGYTPTGFLRKALRGEEITLWGDGSELREFVFINDLIAVLEGLIFGDFSGVLNVVAGRSYSFREALDIVGRLVPGRPAPSSKPRSKDKADNGFDNAALRKVFPDLVFTPLDEGLRRVYDVERESSAAGGGR